MTALPLPAELATAQARAAHARLDAQICASQDAHVCLDASAVRVFDSCTLAVLLACWRSARRAGKTLAVQHLPAGLQALAALYGVDSLLGQNTAGAGEK